MAERHVRCTLDGPASLPCRADPQLFTQAVLNLLLNAVDAIDRDGTVTVAYGPPPAQSDARQFVLSVSDSGPGIPVADRKQIFEAFYQGRTPQGGHVKGTGIGLSVVIEFVNAHGGSIEILEAKSGGAHFRVRLPLRNAPVAASEKANAA